MTETALNLERVQALLKTRLVGRAGERQNELWESIDSTNSRACEIAREGAPAGVIVLAREQTAGRGRLGRQWLSQRDAGLYMSFLLRPRQKGQELCLFTIATGVAVSEALEEATHIKVGLKWVNDLIVDGRKLGGILAEMPAGTAVDGLNSALVIGIGININADYASVPDELRTKLISLKMAGVSSLDANSIAAAIANQLERKLTMLENGQHEALVDQWRNKSITLGKEVQTVVNGRELHGIARDITLDGALLIEKADGDRVMLHAGEVSIRNADGSYA